MLESFIEWLEDHVIDAGTVGLTKAVLGILGFGGVLSALLGSTAVKAAAVVSVLLALLGLFVLLTARLAILKRASDDNSLLLARLCDRLMSEPDGYYRVTAWDQVNVVEANGDTESLITVHGVAECEGLPFFRLRVGCGWRQPLRYRSKVTVEVLDILINDDTRSGSRTTCHWLDDGRLETIVHYSSQVPLGSTFRVTLKVDWPAKCRPLMRDRDPDEFVVRVHKPMTYLSYVVLLPQGERVAYSPIGFGTGDLKLSIKSSIDTSGRWQVAITGRNLAPTPQIGVRLNARSELATP